MSPLVDLSRLAPPVVVEQLDYEVILQAMLTDLQARYPDFTALVESDPAYKILEVAAYRELLLRQRCNDASHACMVAYSVGADLDQLGANIGVPRLVTDPGDAEAVPPVPPTYETDTRYRSRIVSAPEGYSVAGPRGAYIFHGLASSGDVSDVSAVSPTPGQVVITVLSNDGDGTADAPLLAIVTAALNDEDVRPLTDEVIVQSATIVEYAIGADLYIYPGPESEPIVAAAIVRATAYAQEQRRLGRDIRRSAIFAALHVEGVQRVELTAPAADIVIDSDEASYCTAIAVAVVGVDE